MKYLLATILLNLIIFIIESYLDIRQYFHLNYTTPPPFLTQYVTEKQFHDMKTYSLLRLSFSRLQSTFSLFIESLILIFRVLPTLYSFTTFFNEMVFGWNSTYVVGNGITFLILASVLSASLKLPFELYKLSVIDSKFTASTADTFKTVALWGIHQIKALILALFIGVPLLSLILRLLNIGTAIHWSYIWMGSIVVSVVVSELYPNFLQPLFYDVEDFPQSDIRTRIENIFKTMGYPVKTIQLIKNNSSGANVLVTGSAASSFNSSPILSNKENIENNLLNSFNNSNGSGNNLRISIFQNVLEILNEDDLIAILIHELNHFISKDTLKELGMQIVSMAIYLFTLSHCIYDQSFYESFGFFETKNPGIGLLMFSYFFQAFGSLISVITNIVHRQFEYNADIFAEKNGYRIDEALIKMHVDNVFSMIVDKHYSRYYNSHPSLLERLENLALFRERKKKSFVFSPSTGDLVELEENQKKLKSSESIPDILNEEFKENEKSFINFNQEVNIEKSSSNLELNDLENNEFDYKIYKQQTTNRTMLIKKRKTNSTNQNNIGLSTKYKINDKFDNLESIPIENNSLILKNEDNYENKSSNINQSKSKDLQMPNTSITDLSFISEETLKADINNILMNDQL